MDKYLSGFYERCFGNGTQHEGLKTPSHYGSRARGQRDESGVKNVLPYILDNKQSMSWYTTEVFARLFY